MKPVKHQVWFAGSPRERTQVIDRIIFHESAVATLDGTLKALSTKGLSVHYCVDRDGSVTQHAEEHRACAHAGGNPPGTKHNIRSIGIELINRYYGHRVNQTTNLKLYSGEFAPVIISGIFVDRAWSATDSKFLNAERKYIMPTSQQLEASWQLLNSLLPRYRNIEQASWSGVTKTLTGKKVYNWTTLSNHDGPGIKCHAQWAHADGRVVDHYTYLRHAGLTPVQAYDLTVKSASSMQKQTEVP
jgi:N-acetyl-anhydromuramyl-L-alanine amidase AmpD